MSRTSTRPRPASSPSSGKGGTRAVRSLIRFALGFVAVLFALFAGIAAARDLGSPKAIAVELVIALVCGAASYAMGRSS